MRDVKIYVMAHKKFDEPDNTIYIPVQVGAALHDSLGYVADSDGDNISEKNPYYSELTGLYWMWKNDNTSDIVGLCHYRRFFLNNKGELLERSEIESLLTRYDMIVTPKLCYPQGTTVYERYAEKHHALEMDLTRAAIEKYYPEYLKAFDEVLNGREMYYANMFVAPKKIADEYSEWLFKILFDVEANLDMSTYNDYDKRVFGFIAERLIMVWARHNKLNLAKVQVGLMGEKSETVEVIREAAKILSEGRCMDVLEYLGMVNGNRPDLFFKDSDTKGELAAIYTFAEVMAAEERAGKNNLKEYSTDYRKLLKVYSEMKKYVAECGRGKGLYNFVMEKKLSAEFVLLTVRKVLDNKESRISTYNSLASAYLDDGNLHMAQLYVGLALKEGNM